jgi:hypothetical protein
MKKQIIVLLNLIALTACYRVQDDSSKVSIQIPTASQFGKMQNVSASVIDYNLLCFAVNVKGPGITTSGANSCDIDRGLFEGQTKAPGEELVIDVPGGDGRIFEVYAFLKNNSSQSCPIVGKGDWGGWYTNKIYLVGSKEGVTISPPLSTVEIKITLPDSSQNLAAVHSWAPTCLGSAPVVVPTPTVAGGTQGHIVVGAKELSSTNYKMRARVADKNIEQELVGPNYRFKGGVSSF